MAAAKRSSGPDRVDLFNRWHSLALIIGTRAAGKTQALQASVGGSKSPPAPSAKDWLEHRELTGGMLRWLADMGYSGERVIEEMHAAVTEATGPDIQKLLARIEDAEWLVKVIWEDGAHRHLKRSEADEHGRVQWERRVIMHFRGQHTEEVAEEMNVSVGKIRWVRRKHGLTIQGERMYPCTIAPLNACPVCEGLGHYSDDYEKQEAA